MLTQVLIVSSVDKYLDRVYYKSNAIILGLYVSRISSANVTEVCHLCFFVFFRGLLIANSTYSIQIHEITSTKMIPLCNCHKYC